MSALAFPHLWVPNRKLWTPSEWFTTGKAQRKSDGKLPRKTSVGTAGKTPRNTTGTTCCCSAPTVASCPCNSTTGRYSSHLTLVATGISIPLGTCIFDCGAGTGSSTNLTTLVANGTYCLSYVSGGTFLGGPCIYTFVDNTSAAASGTADGVGTGACTSAWTGLTWRVDVDVTVFKIIRVLILIGAATGITVFDSGTVAVPLSCGGTSSSISNISTYCTAQPGPNNGVNSIPGSVTVQDGGC